MLYAPYIPIQTSITINGSLDFEKELQKRISNEIQEEIDKTILDSMLKFAETYGISKGDIESEDTVTTQPSFKRSKYVPYKDTEEDLKAREILL